MKFPATGILVTLFCTIYPQATLAQQQERNWSLEAGAMVFARPVYIGSDQYETVLQPYIQGYYAFSRDSALFIGNDGFGFNHTVAPGLDVGLIGTIRTDRKSSDSRILAGMKDINDAVEFGPYGQYAPNQYITIDFSLLFDVGNVHNGWTASAGMSLRDQIGTTAWSYSFTVSAEYGSGNFNSIYYGVKPSEITATREAFTVGSGFHSINFGGILAYDISENWKMSAFIYLKRLIGDASDSPIVQENNHITAGISATYAF